jgi:ribosomal-protein-alanine N-acetyltransferase
MPLPLPSRVLTRHGFRLEGHLRKDTLIRGEWQDSLLYAILEEEKT